MTAKIVVLADVRASRARVTVQVEADPLAAFWAWYSYWTGDKPKAREAKACDVRKLGGTA